MSIDEKLFKEEFKEKKHLFSMPNAEKFGGVFESTLFSDYL